MDSDPALARLAGRPDVRSIDRAGDLDCAGLRAFAVHGDAGDEVFWLDAERMVSTGDPDVATRTILRRLRETGEALGPVRFARILLALEARPDILIASRDELAAIRPVALELDAPLQIDAPLAVAKTTRRNGRGMQYRFTTLNPRTDELIRWAVEVGGDASVRMTTEVIGVARRGTA